MKYAELNTYKYFFILLLRKKTNKQKTPKKIQTNNKTKFGEQNRDQRAGTEKLHVSTKKIKASGSKIIEEIEKNV